MILKNTIKNLMVLLCILAGSTAFAQFEEVTKIVSTDREGRAEYGTSVAIHENFALVGASRENIASGAAYVYAKDTDGNWDFMQKLSATDSNQGAEYGGGAAFSDDYLVVAAGRANVDGVIRAGALYVYDLDNDTWSFNTKLFASDMSGDAKLGMNPTSMNVHENTIIAGAPGENGWTGSVYVFTKEGGTWAEQQKIMAPNPQSPDSFGIGVAIFGDQMAIGANQADGLKGAVYMYSNNNGVWEYDETLSASDGMEDDYFGSSVSLVEDQMIIGAYGVGGEQGKAYIFEKNSNGTWEEVQILEGVPSTEPTQYGWSTAIQEDYILVTAPHFFGFEAGEVYLYKREASGAWVEDQLIQGSDTEGEDAYGWSVAMYQNQMIAGAPREDHDANGGNEMGDAGSAYIFKDPTMLGVASPTNRVSAISVYPNPVENTVHIGSQTNMLAHLKVYSISGVLVQEVDSLTTNKLTLTTSSYSSGVYFMHVTLEDGSVHIQKILKN
ncbi:T9SS type A sorting domain-containing protein [Marixanthomonas spongiae]|uniref:Adhesin n=1 Tax=Marixanthomonas spongiae TaxID=2174845 RepID=A0A2U0I598_9FLAO|nr:T9SS type A sorting domain-containing protein [Marixanthomonas spongiae]PVW16244.1 adhesin [Marixanthomonas spongiae]